MRRAFAAIGWAVGLVALTTHAAAGDAGLELFEAKIRPLLVEHCYECHSADAKKLGGNLLLDSREGVRTGGDSGAAIVPGEPEESLLVSAVRYSPDAVHMPPKGKLPPAAVAAIENWVKLGAPDPRDAAPKKVADKPWEEVHAERRTWWSMQPVRRPQVPPVADISWSTDPIDHFVLALLEARGLAPVGPAAPRTLVRRLSLVLTGLPPTPAEADAFLQDCGSTAEQPGTPLPPAAVARLVDRLLASPHFGERFARHWMDVMRFSETHGNEWNYEVHHAWRYRDYLVRAFNNDVPYDQLVREHIAGDLLAAPRWNSAEHFNESVIGTAFYRFGEANHDDCISLPQIGYDLADNQIDTLSKAFQATTVACARCHNHKLDAVSMSDYYALLGIVRSSRQVSHTIDDAEVNAAQIARLRELKSALRREIGSLWQRDAGKIARYMQAAVARRAQQGDADMLAAGLDPARLEKWTAALAVEKAGREEPLQTWRECTTAAAADPEKFAQAWRELSTWHAEQSAARDSAQREQFVTYADFRAGNFAAWQVSGQGLRDGGGRSGDFTVAPDGDGAVGAVLPAGAFTHAISAKLNGALRSPVLTAGKKYISFLLAGERSSAVRLVSNNCQLNYKNYKALTSGTLGWVTFEIPENCDSLRTYAELMTMFDNPKFPDQLSALGGDKENYKLPWEKAAENPRSYFGVTRVVLHDGPEPPAAEIGHLQSLLAGEAPATLTALSERYAAVITAAIEKWCVDQATDEDVRWLDELLRAGLLSNRAADSEGLAALVTQYRAVDAELTLPRIIPGVADCGPGFDQPVFVRGDCLRPGDATPRGFLSALSPAGDKFPSEGSGRLELAERIATPANPLTARVMVNRIWHYLFGSGLVRTVDDFGHVGELPSHPELLDYLAAQFVDEGWSVKRIVRAIVLSRTFQLADQPSPAVREIDPQNRLLSYYPARRMEAEAIRDCILATSGRLDRTLGGPSIQPYREKENADRRLFPGPLDGNGRRSIYIKNNLMEAPKFLGAFNFPGGKVARGRRDVTNVPAQALALLNDPFVVAQADQWAGALIARQQDTIATRIDALFAAALGRPATDAERERFTSAAAQFAELHQVPPEQALASREVWRDMAHAIFNLQEFIYIP